MKKRLLKISITMIICLLAIVAIAVFITQTRFFKDWLRDELVAAANNSLNAEVSLGEINGNLITHFALDDLLIKQKTDTLLYLPSLNFRIAPGKLFRKTMQIKILAVDSLQLFIRQQPDSSWNVQHLFAASSNDSVNAPIDSTAEPLQWALVLENMQFNDASIAFFPLKPILGLPERIASLNLQLDARYQQDVLELEMRNLKIRTVEPALNINKLAFNFYYDEYGVKVEKLDIVTDNSQFAGAIHYQMVNKGILDISLTANRLAFSDVRKFLPDVPVHGKPIVDVKAHLANDSLAVALELQQQKQQMQLSAVIPDINSFNNYSARVKFKNIVAESWLPEDSLDITVNGEVNLNGSGLAIDTASAKIDAIFYKLNAWDRTIDTVRTVFDYSAGDLTSTLKLQSPAGMLSLNASVKDVLKTQKFVADLQALNIDLNPIMLSDSLQSDFNFSTHLSGKHLASDSIVCQFHFEGGKSSLLGAEIDTLFSWGSWNRGAGIIDTLRIESPIGKFFLSGDLGLSSNNDLRFHGDVGDLRWVETQIAADTLRAAGSIDGKIQGKVQALDIRGNYNLHNIQYDEIKIDSAKGDVVSTLTNNKTSARGKLFINSFRYAQTGMDTVNIFWGFKNDVFISNVYLARQDTIQSKAFFTYHMKDIPEIHIADFSMRVKNIYWKNSSKNARILLGPNYYDIRGVHLNSGMQNLYVDGVWSDSASSDLQLRIDSLKIKPLAQLLQIKEELRGTVFTRINLQGNAQNPSITGNLYVDNGTVMEFNFERFHGNFSLMDKKLSWDFILNQDSLRGMQFDGFLPVDPSPGESGSFVLEDEPLRIHAINTKKGGLDLSFLQAFLPDMRNVKGRFLANVKVTNTLKNPLPAGSIRVFDGQFSVPRYGVRYKNMQVSVQFDSTDIRIQQFDLHGGSGLLSVSGNLAFTDGLQAGMRSAELSVSAENFQVAKNRDIFLIIDAKGRLFGEVAQPRFDGDVKLRRSTFNLAALENSRYVELEQVQPLLEQARLDTTVGVVVQNQEKTNEQKEATSDVSDYYKNLKGELRIEIGRNSWLRSPSINVEINGELLQSKQAADFEMPVGIVRVVRGNYEFLGKNFSIETGEFTLDGGDEINPLVDLEAVYSIRDADRNKIRILVSGRALDPEIKFYLNNEEIEETNAVSYIVFGRNLEQVSSGERQDLQSGQLLTQLAAAQLTKTLGKKLSLDVIEFQGRTESDAASSITVGRYISDHIFISIQQLIGGDNWETMESLRATLELELRDNIFMQFTKGDEKTTGFDLIWKYQK